MLTIGLLGLRFADWGVEAAAAWIAARPALAPFGYVVTPNADHLVRLGRDPSLVALYEAASLRLLDSRVVARAARLLGRPAPRVATGSDVTAALFARHIPRWERITIVGMRPNHLQALVARTSIAPPHHYDPPMGFEHDPGAMREAVAFVLAHPARLTFLAVGSPRQEMLAAAIAATGRAQGTGLCIGAALEFLAGVQPRAPGWMQAAGLEWLFRLSREPGRLGRRYLIDCPAVFRMLARV